MKVAESAVTTIVFINIEASVPVRPVMEMLRLPPTKAYFILFRHGTKIKSRFDIWVSTFFEHMLIGAFSC